MKLNRNIILLIASITVVLFLLLLFARMATNKKIETAESERKNKNVLKELIDLNQNQHPFFNESLMGKTVVINVWATWCKPCRAEIPELNKLAGDFKNNNIVFVALDELDSTSEMEKMNDMKIKFDYTLLFDQENSISQIQSFLLSNERNGIPINMVINTEGKIETLYVGYDPEKLKEIREYLTSVTKTKI